MSEEKDVLAAMLAQYETNNKPKVKNEDAKVYDLKNYFNVFLKEGVNTKQIQIRILPPLEGSATPFVQMHGHKIKVNGANKIFPCLKHENDEPCPFCEASQALYADGDKELAKKYNARLYYIVKIIDRDAEEEGVKFWRFPHDYRKEGIFDKIMGVSSAIKKDITNAENGRDLVLTINRNQNGFPVVSAVASLDPTPLSTDAAQKQAWLSDKRTWEAVYSTRNYNYLEIIVKGGTPVWSKDLNCFVDKDSLTTTEGTSEDNSEITMGLETLKDNVIASTTSSTSEAEEEEVDDLPF